MSPEARFLLVILFALAAPVGGIALIRASFRIPGRFGALLSYLGWAIAMIGILMVFFIGALAR